MALAQDRKIRVNTGSAEPSREVARDTLYRRSWLGGRGRPRPSPRVRAKIPPDPPEAQKVLTLVAAASAPDRDDAALVRTSHGGGGWPSIRWTPASVGALGRAARPVLAILGLSLSRLVGRGPAPGAGEGRGRALLAAPRLTYSSCSRRGRSDHGCDVSRRGRVRRPLHPLML